MVAKAVFTAARYTAAEAAFILRQPIRAVKKALDTGPVRPVIERGPGAVVRAIGWSDLFYLFAVRELREELTPKARTQFYQALQGIPCEPREEVTFGRYRISVGDLVEEVLQRTADLSKLVEKVEFRADGEPLIKGTEIEVYRISALLNGGSSVEQVLEDYPSLRRHDVETAKSYAESHPKAGRPYPQESAKRALKGAGLEALDDL